MYLKAFTDFFDFEKKRGWACGSWNGPLSICCIIITLKCESCIKSGNSEPLVALLQLLNSLIITPFFIAKS